MGKGKMKRNFECVFWEREKEGTGEELEYLKEE